MAFWSCFSECPYKTEEKIYCVRSFHFTSQYHIRKYKVLRTFLLLDASQRDENYKNLWLILFPLTWKLHPQWENTCEVKVILTCHYWGSKHHYSSYSSAKQAHHWPNHFHYRKTRRNSSCIATSKYTYALQPLSIPVLSDKNDSFW